MKKPIEEDSVDGRFPLTSRNWAVTVKTFEDGVKCIDAQGENRSVAKTEHGVSISSKDGLYVKLTGENGKFVPWS